MRVRALGAMAGAVGALLIAGCGLHSSPGHEAPGSPPGNPVVAPLAGCVTPKLTAPARSFDITEKDNGKTYCVVAGTSMFVFLHSAYSNLWSQIRASSSALQPRPSGMMSLARGVTGAYFLASKLGQVTLESHRAPCHPAAMPSNQGACRGPTVFRVTVRILGRL